MSARKRGRPPLRPEERRSEIIAVRATPAETDALHRFAAEQGVSGAALVRGVVQRLVAMRPPRQEE